MKNRTQYIHNKFPTFIPPINRNKRPTFIYYALKLATQNDVTKNKLNSVIKLKNPKTGGIIIRYRRLNKHRASAMRAIVMAMIYYFNIASNLVQSSVEKLADECGLSTISKSGNKSITRASRLISEFMEPMGFVKCKIKWDETLGTYMPKMIFLTPLFFKLIGISNIKLIHAKREQLKWINKKLKEKGAPTLTLPEIIKKEEIKRNKKILHFRNNQYIFQKIKKYAERLFMLTKRDIRQKIIKSIILRYSTSELNKIGLSGLKERVNIEYLYLKKLAYSNRKKNETLSSILKNVYDNEPIGAPWKPIF